MSIPVTTKVHYIESQAGSTTHSLGCRSHLSISTALEPWATQYQPCKREQKLNPNPNL